MYKHEAIDKNTGIHAKVVADSIFDDSRLLTLETRAPKFLDAEIEKHRMISSNSSSDRAIPFNKMRDAEFFIPQDVRYNEKGMQGFKKVTGDELTSFRSTIKDLRELTIEAMRPYDNVIHKQHLNRYLTGFSFQHKTMTANIEQWEYFLGLRLHSHADPAIQVLAQLIEDCVIKSKPTELNNGQWHLPYITEADLVEEWNIAVLLKKSTARSARTSFMNHLKENPAYKEDYDLYNFLFSTIGTSNQHLTPMEHQAQCSDYDSYSARPADVGISHFDLENDWWSGNFKQPWIQHRKILEHGER